ncbi:two-component sensor histidine kinase [Paenibacillus pectinilyticus]|uniref:histidine kinase n=1 Tax=Paenibacillus pectinilyticus TaxID=512399 RepID=A0A1C1A882_9BACL|nr:sensor histidine kinase [Paenibacillus pectinilyticus]OCT16820.1 two-component sensor histidine kinase [Paenibacillus pectinilyticus]
MRLFLAYFQNLRFKQKLFISYIVVSIIPVVVLGLFSYHQASSFLLQQAKQNLDGAVSQIAETINYRAKQHEAIINSITQNVVFKRIFISDDGNFSDLYRDYVDPFFSNILDFNRDILQISVFTENQAILRGEYILPLSLTTDLQWAKNGRMPSKETQWHIKNGKLFATRPFVSDEEVPLGKSPAVLYLSIDADSLFQGLDDIKAKAYGILILDKEGHQILSKNMHMSADLPIESLQTAQLTERIGSFSMSATDYMYITEEMEEPGWKLVYYTPKNGISVDARSIVSATALITLICLAGLLLIIWMFSNTFVKRIIKLNKKMLIVENGNLKIDVTSQSRDEIGQLTNRFGNMLTNINTLIEEVYQSKITQKEAELKALQTQINPHFLYNTLSIINWKALEIDAMEISQITNTVSRFYRTVLNKGRDFIPVRYELENAKDYMHIQSIMHNYRFDFICAVDEELLQYDMINLIFQPILENALEHGIDKLRKGSERGVIRLRGYRSGDDLAFCIEDNGPGMSKELAEEVIKRNSVGYGLKNVHDRIQIRFGQSYGLRIESEPGQGTRVFVDFPVYTAEELSSRE